MNEGPSCGERLNRLGRRPGGEGKSGGGPQSGNRVKLGGKGLGEEGHGEHICKVKRGRRHLRRRGLRLLIERRDIGPGLG